MRRMPPCLGWSSARAAVEIVSRDSASDSAVAAIARTLMFLSPSQASALQIWLCQPGRLAGDDSYRVTVRQPAKPTGRIGNLDDGIACARKTVTRIAGVSALVGARPCEGRGTG